MDHQSEIEHLTGLVAPIIAKAAALSDDKAARRFMRLPRVEEKLLEIGVLRHLIEIRGINLHYIQEGN